MNNIEKEEYIEAVVNITSDLIINQYFGHRDSYLNSKNFISNEEETISSPKVSEIKHHLSELVRMFINRGRIDAIPLFFSYIVYQSLDIKYDDCNKPVPDTGNDPLNFAKFIQYKNLYNSTDISERYNESVLMFLLINDRNSTTEEQILQLLKGTTPLSYTKDDIFIQEFYNEHYNYIRNRINPNTKLIDYLFFIGAFIMKRFNGEKMNEMEICLNTLAKEYLDKKIKRDFLDYLIKKLRKSQLEKIMFIFNRFKKALKNFKY